jgi:folate-binding protein YgfZ
MTDSSFNLAPGFVSLPNRGVLRLSGVDRIAFLQGLVSNDVAGAHPLYSCLLTPQGKFLHDFFIIPDGESLLIDCEADRRDDLLRRLKTYRLRSKVDIADESDLYRAYVISGSEPAADAIVYADPRSAELGRRVLTKAAIAGTEIPFDAYDRLRIALGVPDGSRDMEVGKAILLENNIDLFNGIAWDKGCYMGQELTARTRYRGLVKKRLMPVRITGTSPAIGAPLIENGVEIGEMRTHAGDLGLALIKLEVARQHRAIAVEGAELRVELPAMLTSVVDRATAN